MVTVVGIEVWRSKVAVRYDSRRHHDTEDMRCSRVFFFDKGNTSSSVDIGHHARI